MSGLTISIEGLSQELQDAYTASNLDRSKSGADAIEWTFGSNHKAFAVARQDGRVAGVSAYIHSRMKIGDRTGSGFQAVDSFVFANMRGKGIFTRLAKSYDAYAKQSGGDVVWGFPNENAAHAWFNKIGWHSHGQVPFLVKPLRAGFFLRKLRFPFDFPLSFTRNQNIVATENIGNWGDDLWENAAPDIGIGTIRNRKFLSYRLVLAPQAKQYRIVADQNSHSPSLVVTREATKHGGRMFPISA